jgi:hypothetical protein
VRDSWPAAGSVATKGKVASRVQGDGHK